MKTKIFKYVISLGLMLVLLIGCQEESFIEQQNTQQLTVQTLFKKPEEAVMLVNGIYDTFHNNEITIQGLYFPANYLAQDFKNWGAGTFWNTYEVPTSFARLVTFWNRSYAGIARANSAIPIITKMKTEGILTEELANRLTGEAIFLRGIFYYYLASEFGGVPLELELTTDDGRHPRNTQDEVFAQVAIDMDAAAKLLPWKQDLPASEIGRANKGAALAYLGDAQIWLKKYAEAVISYEQIKGHSFLEENYMDIHSYFNQNGKESLLEIQYIEQADMRNSNNDVQGLVVFAMPQEVSNTGYNYADKRLYDSFEPGDKRKVATVIGPGDLHPDPLIQIKNYTNVILKFGGMNACGTVAKPWKGSDGKRSGYYGVKTWRDPYVSGNYPVTPGSTVIYSNSGQNITIMRYGQVLLSKAEALLKSGQKGLARDVINNEIRFRAGLGPAPADKDLMQVILDEYRHELNGEFSLWFLLRRSGEHVNYIKSRFNINIPPGKDLLPIPQEAIANNLNLEQNPGY